MKKWASLVMLVASVVGLAACGSSEKTTESAADKKTVVVGLDDTFVPMGFKDDDGTIVGFDVDLAKAVFALTDTKVKFQPIDWSMKETELANGTIDMIWNGYTMNDERKKKVTFSDSYMKNTQVLVTKKSSGITTVDGMKGKILGAQEGSSGYNVFTKQANVLKDIVQDEDATLYASFNEAFIDLEHGRIDGLLVDNVYAGYYLKQAGTLSDYNIIETPYTQESFAVGVRKGDDKLAEKINEGLKTLKENGKYDEIVEKWFGDEATSK
ncbi:amino acid ABC transporter substrate-binding protein [Enterococcus italicus]|uniref:amino acid ABC transporter substrate-binding protein n=1 Tax=Enterococcus italicus TaxID=246144 RepID=UPI002072C175|nr:amino acid ABC transporter substrate-binding protein [Enterococcus italicus]